MIVCALFYGDHPDLAFRLVNSWKRFLDVANVSEFRLGCNMVCYETRLFLKDEMAKFGKPVTFFDSEDPYKYFTMRKMFYSVESADPHIMWFDDDSYLTDDVKICQTTSSLLRDDYVVLGSIYSEIQRGSQYEQIPLQPWYGKRIVNKAHKYVFCTGGWWVAQFDFLKKWNYPFPELRHNGGDTLLGELVRQQSKHLFQYRAGVAINADADGNESKSKRRGLTTLRPWADGKPHTPGLGDPLIMDSIKIYPLEEFPC